MARADEHTDLDLDMDMDIGMDDDMQHEDDVLEETTNLESTFYAQGYDSGHAHGRLHGVFEGRELGREKAWELWEEVGYYEGWAGFWVAILAPGQDASASSTGAAAAGGRQGRKSKEMRTLAHAKQLLDLTASFPRTNPNPSSTVDLSSVEVEVEVEHDLDPSSTTSSVPTPSSTDLAGLIMLIRARYKLLCSSLGVRPRLQGATIIQAASGSGAATPSEDSQGASQLQLSGAGDGAGIVQGIEGPMKGVDTRQLRF